MPSGGPSPCLRTRVTPEEIAARAHERGEPGDHLAHWLTAEQQLS